MKLSVAHARAAALRLSDRGPDVIFSDGEHVGVPLALMMRLRRLQTPHLMLGHHLTTDAKRRVLRVLRRQLEIDRLLVHSSRQVELLVTELGFERSRVALVPYGVDPDFWSPSSESEERLAVSVGREHRDYVTLARACGDLPARVFVAAGSLFSPSSRQDQPAAWPSNFEVGFASPTSLRDWYTRASVVVVPLVPNDFQAGVTVILEAMAMAKPVVVTATAGQRDIIVDGATGVLVPPSDPDTLREVVNFLLAHPHERHRLGANAREAVLSHFSLNVYSDTLAQHLLELSVGQGPASSPCPVPDWDKQPISAPGNRY
jgi:glycosyltransferase involved in cell wall biosynthesis